ncbi:MAG: response regulator [Bdellovibrionaceae bacterium]|nr:response regulator [Pseudobdellovibrionaceae bacterium]MBX3032866.1 response regulator [Pseudobdellovibrionaceae bacterium]
MSLFTELRKPSQLGYFWIIPLIFVILFDGWFLHKSYQDVRQQEAWVTHSNIVIDELDALMSSAKDAETGMRGFMLTNNEDYLEPYQRGRSEIWVHFNRAVELTRDNPYQNSLIKSLESIVRHRIDLLERNVENIRKNREQLRAQGFLSTRDGRIAMETLREAVDNIKKEELRILGDRAEKTRQSEVYFRLTVVLTTFISLVIVMFAFAQSRRYQMRIGREAEIETRRAWKRSRVADVAQLLASDLNLVKSARAVIDYFTNVFHVQSANLYMVEQGALRLKAGVSAAPAQIGMEENLASDAFRRGGVTIISDVPPNYLPISSSVGEAPPRYLIFVPIRFQNKNIGLLELATFQKPEEDIHELLSEIGETIGVGLNASQSKEHLQLLLEKTQQQAEELQAQQEELRTNNEELEEQTRVLENQQHVLNLRNEELNNARIEVEQRSTALEQAGRYKSDFLAKMSHELRTPLNSLLILATLLMENREGNLTEKQRDFARSIHSAGNDLLDLINDILDLSKIEAQKLVLRPENFTLQSLTEQKRITFRHLAAARHLQYDVILNPALAGKTLYTDRQRLEQILRNFLSNAIKFTEKGSVTLRVDPGPLPGEISFSVEDTGIGIPKAKKDLIFEAFVQADDSVSRRFGGTGLGLTISRELSGLLGGRIQVTSEEGKGSTFTLFLPERLPVQAPVTENFPAAPPPAGAPTVAFQPRGIPELAEKPDVKLDEAKQRELQKLLASLDPSRKTILIVEDDATFRHSVAEAVRTYGFEAIEADDGEVALAILNTHTPSAILLDIKLPGISGMGLLEMIKQMPHLRHLPIHMISALEYQQNALRLGAMGYLGKPVTIDKVRAALDRIEGLLSKKVKNLLVVEDDERQRQAISLLVSGDDINIRAAATGKETLDFMRNDAFDCIILDLNLPDMNGFELLERLSQMNISLPPIVIYTGKDLSREEADHLRKYSESIIIKGAKSPERLLDEVNLFLHRVEALLPADKQRMLHQLRSQEKVFEGKSVLLVDDDLRNVFALTNALEERGLKVRAARDGIEALERLEENGEPDVILMDIMMPRMDGFETMRQIRQMERFRRIPIIALTAKAMKEDHEKCIEAGANDYLPKPINLLNLTSVLKVWLTPKGGFPL